MDKTELAIIVVVPVVSMLVGAWLGRKKGDCLAGVMLGLFFGPLGWLLILLRPNLKEKI